jgi:hypothetical protein
MSRGVLRWVMPKTMDAKTANSSALVKWDK